MLCVPNCLATNVILCSHTKVLIQLSTSIQPFQCDRQVSPRWLYWIQSSWKPQNKQFLIALAVCGHFAPCVWAAYFYFLSSVIMSVVSSIQKILYVLRWGDFKRLNFLVFPWMKYMALLCHSSKVNTVQQHYQNYFLQFCQNFNMLVLLNVSSFTVLTEWYDEMDSDTFIIIFYQIKKFSFVYFIHF